MLTAVQEIGHPGPVGAAVPGERPAGGAAGGAGGGAVPGAGAAHTHHRRK